ncbi:hypothetical protein [Marinisporobacter balticus]|uniref:Uncharacterized protein n=1 Tax=Marinisporobacter balticus TaxID=2018667 RepID=A0A4R2KZZ0_9FIRM|nr:hypothetical protein [Marinisporobacter balticus]TCO79523.1 hypothetical protein EV214_102247 [Marinisporobacter balticus]
MRIGVKYCGGCNPRYERKAFVDKVSKNLGEMYDLVVAKEGEIYDFILVMGGCMNCCANFKHVETRRGVFCVKSAADYEKVLNAITKIGE